MKINTIQDVRAEFARKLKDEEFVIDKNGGKTIEILGASFIADEESIFGKLNVEYADAEIKWYESQSLNVYDIAKYYKIVPKIWKDVADNNGMINSNYGYVCFSEQNGNQYSHVLNHLKSNIDTRHGIIIFNRPSIHIEAFTLNKQDMMCVQNSHFLIRDNKLEMIACTRSMDSVFGYLNDLYFFKYLHNKLFNDLISTYPNLEIGQIKVNANSLHVYERHFELVE